MEFRFGFEKFVKLHFTTPYCKVMNERSNAALKSAFILYGYMLATYLTFYPFEDFQYHAVSVQNITHFRPEMGSVLKIHFMRLQTSREE